MYMLRIICTNELHRDLKGHLLCKMTLKGLDPHVPLNFVSTLLNFAYLMLKKLLVHSKHFFSNALTKFSQELTKFSNAFT